MAEPLASVDVFGKYLRTTSLDTDAATFALAGASGLVRDYCRWDISRNPLAEWFCDGTGTNILTLPTLKLNDVLAVYVDTEPLDYETGYRWTGNGQLARVDGGVWPRKFGAIQVDADHGYDPVPDTVALVACAVAARYYANPERLRAKGVGAVSRTFSDDLMDLEMKLLDGYRLP